MCHHYHLILIAKIALVLGALFALHGDSRRILVPVPPPHQFQVHPIASIGQ